MKFLISLIKIPVSNIEISLHFYEEHLKIKNIFYVKEYGWAQFELDGVSFALYQVNLGGGFRNLGGSIDFHLALDEDSFNIVTSSWKLANILKDNMIHTGNDGSKFVELLDPDENELKVMCIKK